MVDAESKLMDPYWYGDDSSRGGERTGLAEGTSGGVRMRSSRRKGNVTEGAGKPCTEKVNRLPSLITVQ